MSSEIPRPDDDALKERFYKIIGVSKPLPEMGELPLHAVLHHYFRIAPQEPGAAMILRRTTRGAPP